MPAANTQTDLRKLLIVEDNTALREQMKWALGDEYEVFEADSMESSMEALKQCRIPMVCLDLGLEDKADRGLEIIDALLMHDRQAKIIVVTSNTTHEMGALSVQHGAFDYLQKPIDIEELKVILSRAARIASLEVVEKPDTEKWQLGDSDFLMIGASEPMQRIFENIRKLAGTDVSVLITGESGTGKELCARAIHYHSSRRNEPFVPINCAALPDNLLESELFGYVKGAFTGAGTDKVGLIESAHMGTLFLDEIGDMPMVLQVKLLRFLQDQKLQRVGDITVRPVDVRIIAATNRTNLSEKDNHVMRTDLYYRLSEFEINLPPIRERGEDVLAIANRILDRNRTKFGQPRLRLSKRAEKMVLNYTWPGNVRELENKMNRAAITCQNQVIEDEDLNLGENSFANLSYREAKQKFERSLVLGAMRRAKGNVTLAARTLGVTRPTLYDMIRKNGLELHDLHTTHNSNGNEA